MRPRQRGFTLIELIVVLTLISVLLAVAAPRLSGRSQIAALRGAAQDVQTLAGAARAQAVLGEQVVGLMLTKGGTELRLIAEKPNKGKTALVDLLPLRRLPPGIRAQFQPAGKVKPGATADLIRFRPDGSADGGDLQVSDAQGAKLRYKLSEALGQLRLASVS